jgi:peptide chain release factor subunit 1
MFTETSLRKIQDFSAIHPVVSLYLNTEPSRGNAETHRLRLRNMLRSLPLEKDVERIEEFFNHQYDWSGRAVAVFSSAPANFFEFIPISVPIKDFIKVGSRTEIEPLSDLLEEFSDLGVALVDQQGGRFFHFHLGELVVQEGVLGEQVKHVKTGSASSEHGLRGGSLHSNRGAKEKVDRNMRETVEFGEKFFLKHRVKRIMVGGNEENSAHFRASLAKPLQGIVVGTFAMEMTANHSEVFNKIVQLAK